LPADPDDLSEGAERIRHVKSDVQERLEVDHRMAGDANDGEHKKLTMPALTAPGTPAAGKLYLYYDTADSALKVMRSDGVAIFLTNSTSQPDKFVSGTRMVFAQAAAPLGWTQVVSIDDKVLRVTDGTGYISGGSWTISGVTVDGHAITIDEMPSHDHRPMNGIGGTATNAIDATTGFSGRDNDDAFVAATNLIEATGGGDTHTHGLTADGNWRPAYLDIILATKD